MDNSGKIPKTCPKCGAAFFCGSKTNSCWCTNYTLDEATLKQISEKYADCLCEDCIKEIVKSGEVRP